ncbi:MAG TPA: hypothetical protein QGF04_01310 [Woeseiaceae bacterium]|nr:hypothetical protein [Woeseiaceae bacterium]
MNLLMLILIFLAICVSVGIAYSAWKLIPKITKFESEEMHNNNLDEQ